MAKLVVQLDPVAALRQAGRSIVPEPAAAAVLAELGGADGIAVHLREDRRFIQDRDLPVLKKVVHTRFVFKMGPTSEMLGVALNIKPDAVILVPEMREGNSAADGLDLMVHGSNTAEIIDNLFSSGIPVGAFIEPDPDQVKLAHQCRVNFVEINTGTYVEATTIAKRKQVLSRIVDTVKLAYRLKIGVQAGGGIDYNTIGAFEGLGEIGVFTIGRSIVSRAVLIGMQEAVREMRRLIREL
ncbi:MAG: pyridoxine 5'-phosphate synthase [Deltaproteobacteria bacterium]|nr:pyridoxine 5'-phosphate synthase [Deltaproteobacteria bacterium]